MSRDLRNIGLREIFVADTLISKIESDTGTLLYRGFNIQDLVANSTFEETVYLLLYNQLPTKDQLLRLRQKMRSYREPPDYLLENLYDVPKAAPTMSVLMGSIPMIACFECNGALSKEETKEVALKVISLIPTLIAYWYRIKNNFDIVKPSNFPHAANFLYMLKGQNPEEEIIKIFDECLILHAEHSFNASTFAAREVASTGASIYASLTAGIAALSGELHGGANTKVMEMLEEIGDVTSVEEWIKGRLDQGKRIMGLGHAVYKTFDPRAEILKERSKRLAAIKGESRWYEITHRLEEYGRSELERRKGHKLFPNVDLYTPSVYHLIEIPKDLFTPIFAMARTAGWCAHVIEEKFAEAQPKPVLYRPKAKYIGNYCGPDECAYTPLEKR